MSPRLIVASFLLLLSTTGSSHAYLDPGTGSLLLQSTIAVAAAAAASIGLYWSRAKLFVSRLLGRSAPDKQSTDE